jgi:hypothetical protein
VSAVLGVWLAVVPMPLHVALKDAPRVVESIVDRSVKILVQRIRAGAIAHDEVCARDAHFDSNTIGRTVLLPMVRRLESHVASRHPVRERLELRGAPPNVVVDSRRCLDATKRDLNGGLHFLLQQGAKQIACRCGVASNRALPTWLR